MGAFRISVPKFFCAQKSLFWTYNAIKTKIFTPNSLFYPQNLATGLLYASLHFQTCVILAVLNLQIVISVHIPFLQLTLWYPVGFRDFCAKTTGLHVALRTRNPGAESGRELFKGSKEAATFLVCTQQKIRGIGVIHFLWVMPKVEDF